MRIDSRTEDGVVVVAVEGRLHREWATTFMARAESIIGDRWHGRILLDCTNMTYISTAGLREILLIAKRVAKHNGRFAICTLAEGIDRAFEVIGFNQIMNIHNSHESAMAGLAQEH